MPNPRTSAPPDLFTQHLSLVSDIIAAIRRRQRLSASDADDFTSLVHGKLIDDDQRVLRLFEGRSSLRTYLTAVIQRLFLDFRASQWGKWRPSALAVRLGPVAVRLESLLMRDRFSFDEAVGVLMSRSDAGVTRDELYGIASQLPPRVTRRPAPEEEADEPFDEGSQAEDAVLLPERRAVVRRALNTLGRAVQALEPGDRVILRMRFEDDTRVAAIAAQLKMEAKPLYRRIERLLRTLREELEADGLTADELTALIGRPDFDLLAEDEPRPS